MIKISKLVDYAIVILSAFPGTGESESAPMSAMVLSDVTQLPEPTVAKILKILARGRILDSARGANGGYKLARSVQDISIAEVIEAIEGPLALTACVETSEHVCNYASVCGVKGRWDDVNAAVLKALENVSLGDMVAPANMCAVHAGARKAIEGRYGSN